MAKQSRRQYTEEFKREAVKLVEEQGRGIAEVARSLGVHRSQVERWRGRYSMAVASSSPYRELIALLEHNGLRDHFVQVVGGDMVHRKKPAPDIYRKAVSLLGMVPSACIAFEDSQSGVEAAKSAGLAAVAVPHAMSLDHDFSSADMVLDSLADFDERSLQLLATLIR